MNETNNEENDGLDKNGRQFLYWDDYAGLARQLHFIARRIEKLIDGNLNVSEPEVRLLAMLLDSQRRLYPRLEKLFDDEIIDSSYEGELQI